MMNVTHVTHERFNRMVWISKKDLTGGLAKWLVILSPYTVPEKLSEIITEFGENVPYAFDTGRLACVSLATMCDAIYKVFEKIPNLMALNERKNGRQGVSITTRYSAKPEPVDDFIDIMALAQNVVCEFADREDAREWLNRMIEAGHVKYENDIIIISEVK